MYELMVGRFEHLGGRWLGINGLRVLVPEDGAAHIGIQLKVREYAVVPCVCALKGIEGQRYGFLHVGVGDMGKIVEKILEGDGGSVGFTFLTPFRRPFVTGN